MKPHKNLIKSVRKSLSIILTFSLSHFLTFSLSYGAFDEFSASPRVLSMGGASIALSDDASAVNSNPAGLIQIETTEVMASYSDLYNTDGLSRGHIAVAIPSGANALGFSFNRLSLKGIYDEDVLSAAFSRQLSNHLAVGLAVRILSDEIHDAGLNFYKGRKYSGTYSVGMIHQAADNWLFAITGENLNEPAIAAGEKNSAVWKGGVRFHPFETGLMVLDYNVNSNDLAVGFEVIIGDVLPLRLGFRNQKPTFGFGIRHNFLNFDFAILSDTNLGLQTQAGMRIRI